jgi:hypothetical protein
MCLVLLVTNYYTSLASTTASSDLGVVTHFRSKKLSRYLAPHELELYTTQIRDTPIQRSREIMKDPLLRSMKDKNNSLIGGQDLHQYQ